MTMLARAGWIASCKLCCCSPETRRPSRRNRDARPRRRRRERRRCVATTAITIVAENGAKFELRDRNRDGHVDSVELSSKALLLEVPKKPGRARFEVVTPQAIAAVRGTKWAVDAEGGKDFRVRRRRPCQRRARSRPRQGRCSGPAKASMSRRRANWSSSAGRPRASRP